MNRLKNIKPNYTYLNGADKDHIIGTDDILFNNVPATQPSSPSIYTSTMFIKNITLRNLYIIISNAAIVFLNCNFYNVSIKNNYSESNETLGHIQLTFINSTYRCEDKNDVQWYGIYFHSMTAVKIGLSKTFINNCKFYMSPHDIFLTITESLLINTSLHIIARYYVNFRVHFILFSQTNFTQGGSNLVPQHILLVLQNPYVIIDNCNFNNLLVEIMQANINSQQKLFKAIIKQSLFIDTSLDIIAGYYVGFIGPFIIIFSNANFTQGGSNLLQKHIFLVLRNLNVIMDFCNFNNVSVVITQANMNTQQELYKVMITQSLFRDTIKYGNGGSLLISSHVVGSTINLREVTFIRNKARKFSSAILGKGGAVYIAGSDIILQIDSCNFGGNVADDQGTSLYASEAVNIEIRNSTFLAYMSKSGEHSIMYASGNIHKLVANFVIIHQHPNLHNSHLQVFSAELLSNNFIFSVYCPPWHRNVVQYKVSTSVKPMQENNKSMSVMKNFIYECRVCSDGYYFPSFQGNIISYENKISSQQSLDCIKCPYGAICSGNNIVPRPNYWGYWRWDELAFEQCPARYCCANTENARCEKYDSCAGNRTGIICGACRKGFSVSILTGECMPDSECGHHRLFWVLALLATVAYALWYTFKDDLVLLSFKTLDSLKYVAGKFIKCCKNDFQSNILAVEVKSTEELNLNKGLQSIKPDTKH